MAYCLLGYLCAYYRYYNPLEFITSFLNNASNDDDIQNGTELAKKKGIKIIQPKFGFSKSDYFLNKEKNVIAKGLSSIKYIGKNVADELYQLANETEYSCFIDLLDDLNNKTSVDSRQLEILIKIDFFSDFGNQRELFKIMEFFEMFKKGSAKQIKKSSVDGTPLEEIVKRHAVGVTKSGGEAKSYTLLDVMSILHEIESYIYDMNLPDLRDIDKVRNFHDIMGYLGYISGKDTDRRKLYVTDVKPLYRKRDGKQFGYSVFTKSIGSGKESRFTVNNREFDTTPIKKNDIVYCKQFERDGVYYKMTAYEHVF